MKAILLFTLCFLGINFLIFLPIWIVGIFSKIEGHKNPFFRDKPYFIFKKILYQRFTNDCFRLGFEIQILSFFILLLNDSYREFFKVAVILFIMISFIYITYISIIIYVFKKEPILINDVQFTKTGIMVFKKKIPLVLFGIFIILACVLFIGKGLVEALLNFNAQIEQKWPLIITMFLSIVVSVFSILKIRYDRYHSSVSFSLIKHLVKNLIKCRTLKRSLKTLNKELPYNYINNIKLKVKPNIIFVFLESYGSFALSKNKYSSELIKKMEEINKSLTINNYQTVSTLSESPVSSGGSWLSHSSILFGANIRDIAAHELIFSHTENVSKLASLPKYLDTQGYNTTLTSTLSYEKDEVNWKKVKNAYPFENMMLFNDFNYKGKLIKLFGDRFVLPDEYTLNYAYNSLQDKSPFFLSVNTINSHYSFISPIVPKKHWNDYNIEDFALTDGLKKNNLKNYFLAINYQLDYLHSFLINYNLDNTVTVLIGDHQPPLITPSNIDKATPIHVISKNNDIINAFKEFEFTEGLVPKRQTQKHQSFFSKFLYVLNKVYGENKNLELPVFEDGVNLY